jgi:hypothetical protein
MGNEMKQEYTEIFENGERKTVLVGSFDDTKVSQTMTIEDFMRIYIHNDRGAKS